MLSYFMLSGMRSNPDLRDFMCLQARFVMSSILLKVEQLRGRNLEDRRAALMRLLQVARGGGDFRSAMMQAVALDARASGSNT